MLQTSGIYIIKDGVELESKPNRKGATQFTVISNSHKIVDIIFLLAIFNELLDSGLMIYANWHFLLISFDAEQYSAQLTHSHNLSFEYLLMLSLTGHH
jgi:hypothetical protein